VHFAADALLPVEGGEVGNGRGMLGVGRRAHSRRWEALAGVSGIEASLLRGGWSVGVEETWVAAGKGGV
jgi:hypothetical protein